MKASKPVLTSSACVVHMPCGNFSKTFRVPFRSGRRGWRRADRDERRPRGGVRGVVVHVVAIADLTRPAMTAAVMRDHAIALVHEVEHLGVPVVGAEWPPVMEDDGLRGAGSAVLVVDRRAIPDRDRAHRCSSWRSPFCRGALARFVRIGRQRPCRGVLLIGPSTDSFVTRSWVRDDPDCAPECAAVDAHGCLDPQRLLRAATGRHDPSGCRRPQPETRRHEHRRPWCRRQTGRSRRRRRAHPPTSFRQVRRGRGERAECPDHENLLFARGVLSKLTLVSFC